jgi:hypothetical protein
VNNYYEKALASTENSLTCEQEFFVPQQKGLGDALSTVHAGRRKSSPPSCELVRARYNFYLVKLTVPVQTPL